MHNKLQFLIVNHNTLINKQIEDSLKQIGVNSSIKVALNGGHALMCLEHYHLCNKIKDCTLIVLLNLNTPMVDGLEFLKNYQDNKSFLKENIIVIGLNEGLSVEKKAVAEELGLKRYVNSEISESDFTEVFQTEIPRKEEVLATVTIDEPSVSHKKNKMKRRASAKKY
jgi:response regulator RpfG family c-di-GMP phosphodiesterase